VARLPRGIQLIDWRNADKSKSIRYRVRIQRKTFQADELFETLEDAEKFLADTKSEKGRQALLREQADKDAIRRKALALGIKDFLTGPLSLSSYLDHHAAEHYPKPPDDAPEAKKKWWATQVSRIEVIKRVKVEAGNAVGKNGEPLIGRVALVASRIPALRREFGTLQLSEITRKTASSYIEERQKQVSLSTVKRDVSFLRSFFNTLYEDDEEGAKALGRNPFASPEIQRKLKKADKRRDVRLKDFGEDAQERLFNALRACRNPEMLQVVALSLATGMRRGEVLAIEWNQVGDDFIALRAEQTKSKEPRKVPLTAEAREILSQCETDKSTDGRVFSYTADGFRSVYRRVRVKAGLLGFRFHDLRHEYVSRILETLSSPVAAAELAGQSVRHIEEQHLKPLGDRKALENGIQSEHGLRLAVGHKDSRMTQHYASGIAKKVAQNVNKAASASKAYPILIEAQDGQAAAYSPDFGLSAAASTEAEAVEFIKGKIVEWMKLGEPLPEPTSPMQCARDFPGVLIRMMSLS
jgi:integrase